MSTLTNPRAERVKAVRALSERAVRKRAGRFVVEGPQAVREAVLAGADVHDVYVTTESAQRYPEIVVGAQERGIRVSVGHGRGARRDEPGRPAGRRGRVAHGAPPRELDAPRLVAILANVRDPGNAGTVIRAADAAGADAAVLTSESVDVHNPKVVRSTAGSLFHLPVVTGRTSATTIDDLRAAGLLVLAADGVGTFDLDDLLDVVGSARGRRPGPGAPDRVAVRQRGVGSSRRGPRAGRRGGAGADPGAGRVAEPRDRGDGLPLRRARGRTGEAVRGRVAARARARPPRRRARRRCAARRRGCRQAVRWSARETWHLTTAFYGEVPDGAVPALTGELAELATGVEPYELALHGAGVFSHRTLWVGVGGDVERQRA